MSGAPVTDPFESNPTDDITSGRQSLSPKILVLNAKSIRNNVFDLQALLLTVRVDIVALTETSLDDDFQDSELHLNDYNVFRKDKFYRRGGGVLLAIRDQISNYVVTNYEFLVEDVLVHPNAFDSDHHPLTFKFRVKTTRPKNAQHKVSL